METDFLFLTFSFSREPKGVVSRHFQIGYFEPSSQPPLGNNKVVHIIDGALLI